MRTMWQKKLCSRKNEKIRKQLWYVSAQSNMRVEKLLGCSNKTRGSLFFSYNPISILNFVGFVVCTVYTDYKFVYIKCIFNFDKSKNNQRLGVHFKKKEK